MGVYDPSKESSDPAVISLVLMQSWFSARLDKGNETKDSSGEVQP